MPNSTSTDDHGASSGTAAVVVAFFIWGLFPLYLKPLAAVPATQISAWRSLLGCAVVMALLKWRGELSAVWQVFTQPALLRRLALTSALLSGNWVLYAWGVTHGHVLMTSLGYFINPLVSVLLGVVVLSERLDRPQWIAVALAGAAVLALTLQTGELPWISLGLAISFSLYGLLRKTAASSALIGLAVENLLASPIAAIYLVYVQPQHSDIHYTPLMLTLLAGSGIVTIVPLALFNYGTRRISFVTAGMLQFIGPTLQFLIGVFVYNETLSSARLTCFAVIWFALIIYACDRAWHARKLKNLQ